MGGGTLYLFALLITIAPAVYSVALNFEDSIIRYEYVPHSPKKPSCGYSSCPPVKKDMINVHLVPHTHDDVGWLKTVDQYYFGSKSSIQKAGVQYILDSVVKELLHDPTKKFVYVETAYLWKWWKEQHDTIRHQVKNLINNGQLEIIGGAWSMNDEAVTHYQSIIDQFTWGLRKLNDTFGDCGRPRVGWQIDPFGHSREMASIFSQMGYDGLFFGRLDYQDKTYRIKSKTTEMLWQGSNNLGKASQLFTSILYNGYGPPPGFCFDVLCDDEPMIDDRHSPDYNVNEKVDKFIHYAEKQAKAYASDNIVMTMGGDFTFQNAEMWYKNLDKLKRYVNAQQSNDSRVNVFYSTPSCYLKSVNDEDLSWTIKQDDFFPYASDSHAYWTGFYSSRPTIKYFERQGNNFLQVCKQLYALADLGPEDWADLNKMREAMGVMQHHDAITGTEKQSVAQDYARILSEGMAECLNAAKTAINKLIPNQNMMTDVPPINLNTCLLLNISQCAESEDSENFVVTLYNPLSRPVWRYVRLPIVGTSFSVEDPNGKLLPVQLVPIPESVLRMPGRNSNAVQELVFLAEDLPPLGFRSFFISRLSSSRKGEKTIDLTYHSEHIDESQFDAHSKISIGNEGLSVEFDRKTGLADSLHIAGRAVKLKQDFYYYKGAVGNNMEFLNRSSGAYIFRPNGSIPIQVAPRPRVKVYKGVLVEEVHQVYSDWVSQVIRVYKGENHVEFEWMVGPVPINDKIGKEVISTYTTNLDSNEFFYTDSNGREMLQRKRNFRPTWKVKIAEPIAGNYYPITSRIVIKDENARQEVAVLTDRAQGGGSLSNGQVELMVHRRLLHDDAFGVDEALNETAYGLGVVARGRHFVMGGPMGGSQGLSLAAQERELAQRKLLSPWMFITPANGSSFTHWSSLYRMEFYGLLKALPPSVQILTLEPWKAHSFLLRLEHIMEKTDDPALSKPVTVSLKMLFSVFTIKSARETTLGANQWLAQSQRLIWKAESNEIEREEHRSQYHNFAEDILSVTLNPMQIRTFIIEIESKL